MTRTLNLSFFMIVAIVPQQYDGDILSLQQDMLGKGQKMEESREISKRQQMFVKVINKNRCYGRKVTSEKRYRKIFRRERGS